MKIDIEAYRAVHVTSCNLGCPYSCIDAGHCILCSPTMNLNSGNAQWVTSHDMFGNDLKLSQYYYKLLVACWCRLAETTSTMVPENAEGSEIHSWNGHCDGSAVVRSHAPRTAKVRNFSQYHVRDSRSITILNLFRESSGDCSNYGRSRILIRLKCIFECHYIPPQQYSEFRLLNASRDLGTCASAGGS